LELFELKSLLETRAESGRLYHEFLRKDSLSMGLYVLAAGATDPQQPHTEDEVYYVISGRGQIQVGIERQAVGPGSTVFVAAGVRHFFHSIEEELQILVFFAPAEYSRSKVERALV
jgi:quercetin dioxygenase-like cupin family protein